MNQQSPISKTQNLSQGYIGKSVPRREDARLLDGAGQFIDNMKLPNMTYSAVLRSPYAHARLLSINTEEALSLKGIVGILTGEDLKGKVGLIRPNWIAGQDIQIPDHPVLAFDKVNYTGDAVAFIVGESREAVQDALEMIEVEYEVLDPIIDEEEAFQEGAVQIHEGIKNNRAGKPLMAWGDYRKAAEEADQIVSLKLINNRLIPSAMEPRVLLASFDKYSEKLEMYIPSQVPHLHRRWISDTLGWPEHKIHLKVPDIGGGFGAKMHLYVEEILVAYAAKHFGCPIKWTETRSESHLSTHHGRAHTQYIDLAIKNDGTVLGLKLKLFANMGAYLSNMATGVPSVNCTYFANGNYNIPNYFAQTNLIFTNTVPVDAYRGAGRPEATYLIERSMDKVAEVLGMDPLEVRRKNVIQKFPHNFYDSGSFLKCMEEAKSSFKYEEKRELQAQAREEGRYLGIGIINYTESCGMAPSTVLGNLGFDRGGYESAEIKVHPDGKVTLFTGSTPQGHGHHTSFAQIVASELQIPMEDVEVITGDTEAVPVGVGTYNSRSMAVGGSAAKICAGKVIEKAKKYAALKLRCKEESVLYQEGHFFTEENEKRIPFAKIARMAAVPHHKPEDVTPGLDQLYTHDPISMSSPNGSHAAFVEVDIETGKIEILEYLAVDDAGNLINPMLAEGQIHGGIAQGIGQALYENTVYSEDGQLLSGSLLDYAVPKADQLPSFKTDFLYTPTQTNPLGAKGIGEAGTIAAPPALVSAVCDALKPFGIDHIDMPLTPPKIWKAIQSASQDKGGAS
ncbi:molybdopterin-dependent oxidoreductase [Sneathiella sp. P13V-1]|uniref:xanthine dehydrogenase family protein molybdopterin-binding subunit n=1 Tax=Sneathiella sp. P13V-1 TaxID=2697366 RepID=UPI00187B1C49|nr:xanthine dehydrogenase family protein molybdopterin-binding subunit [Sneathiella sp. P13V-1]MBE7637734.1 molybdopterin-dependent oxidoreductase [Sneathiella sp. P13V-1]